MADLQDLTIDDTGFLKLPSGTTAQRPSSPEAGDIRYNTDEGYIEWYDPANNEWVAAAFPPAT